MKKRYYDLNIRNPAKEMLEKAKKLGWSEICITQKAGEKNLELELNENKISNESDEIFVHKGVEISHEDPRKFLDKIIFTNLNRELSKLTEVDVFTVNFESKENRLDYITAKNMAENGIALEFRFSDILNSTWSTRVKIMNIMRLNLITARKYKVPFIITSGALTPLELRHPKALISIGKVLGMSEEESKDAVTKNPEKIINKVKDRNDDSVIMSGLKIVKFGKIKKEKKKFGYY